MSLFTRPRFEDRQIVQYSGTSITLSGETNINNFGYLQINAPILDFTGTTSASTLYTLAGVSGYVNEGLVSSFIFQPPIILQSGATGTTSVDVTGYYLGGLDSGGTITWLPPTNSSGATQFTGNTSASCITDLYVTNIHGCSPITIWDSIQSNNSQATGTTSFAFGNTVSAFGDYSHAEGNNTVAIGQSSHAEGNQTKAIGVDSHSEGQFTTASGNFGSHAEGNQTTASGGFGSHAEGFTTQAIGQSSHAEGGSTTAVGIGSHAEGANTTSFGSYSHAEGQETQAIGQSSHAEGSNTTAAGVNSHSEGYFTIASGISSHSEGGNYLLGFVNGRGGTAIGDGSHAEGLQSSSVGNYSHAEGSGTTSIGLFSHAEGQQTTAGSTAAHSEGRYTIASGDTSHAEGWYTIAKGISSHAEGVNTQSLGDYSHSEGIYTIASGYASHAGGWGGEFTPPGGNPINKVIASGGGSFNHSVVDNTYSGTGSSNLGTFILGGFNNSASKEWCGVIGGAYNDLRGGGLPVPMYSVIVGGTNNVIYTGYRSIVLGGNAITGTSNDTVYVPDFVIKKVATVPTGSTDTIGEIGSITYDDDTLYIKTPRSGGTWGKVSLNISW